MFTTDGSSCFASWAKPLESCTGLGIASGVAPGATAWSFAAFTPVDTTVPMRTPMDKVNRRRLSDSNFCLRILLKKLIEFGTPKDAITLHYTSGFALLIDRCSLE